MVVDCPLWFSCASIRLVDRQLDSDGLENPLAVANQMMAHIQNWIAWPTDWAVVCTSSWSERKRHELADPLSQSVNITI